MSYQPATSEASLDSGATLAKAPAYASEPPETPPSVRDTAHNEVSFCLQLGTATCIIGFICLILCLFKPYHC